MSADFLDSNVFVYIFDETEPYKRRIAEGLIAAALRDGSGIVSYQVIQEVLNVLLRKIDVPASSADAWSFVDQVLLPMWQIQPSPALYRHAIEVRERYQLGFYDSLVVAAALDAGCTRLYSEDLSDGQRIERLTIENPFRV